MKSKTASLVGKTTFCPFGLLKSDAILANIRFGATPVWGQGEGEGYGYGEGYGSWSG